MSNDQGPIHRIVQNPTSNGPWTVDINGPNTSCERPNREFSNRLHNPRPAQFVNCLKHQPTVESSFCLNMNLSYEYTKQIQELRVDCETDDIFDRL